MECTGLSCCTSLCRGQKHWKRPSPGHVEADGYCWVLQVLTLLQWLPWVQHGPELLWRQVVTVSVVTNLQRQNYHVTEGGERPCFQSGTCKSCYQPKVLWAFHHCQAATLQALLQLPNSSSSSSSNELWAWESEACASLVGSAGGSLSAAICTGLPRCCRKGWLLSVGRNHKHRKGLVYKMVSLRIL